MLNCIQYFNKYRVWPAILFQFFILAHCVFEFDTPALKHIRDKAGINKEPYFWHKGVLMRKPYNTLGKDLIMVPKVARS